MLAKILIACKAVKRSNLGRHDIPAAGARRGFNLPWPLRTAKRLRWLAESPDESGQRNADEKDV